MKAIDTVYKGFKFRSRTEARWAVFFDGIGIRWEYEKEGFEHNNQRYLPDFYFPDYDVWGEIKPKKIIDDNRWYWFVKEKRLWVFFGQPYDTEIFEVIDDYKIEIAPFCDLIYPKYGDAYYVPGNVNEWFENEPYKTAVLKSKSARFEFEDDQNLMK